MVKTVTRFLGFGLLGENSRFPKRDSDHINISQTTEGWVGSGFKEKTTTINARRVWREDKATGAEDELQVEIGVNLTFDSDRSRHESAGFYLEGKLAETFIEFLAAPKGKPDGVVLSYETLPQQIADLKKSMHAILDCYWGRGDGAKPPDFIKRAAALSGWEFPTNQTAKEG